MRTPIFPDFREIAIEDSDEIEEHLASTQPETSEMTFASLFIWQREFRTEWSMYDRWLLFMERREGGSRYFLPPAGESVQPEVVIELLAWLRDVTGDARPAIERADCRLAALMKESFDIEPMPEHFDYVYRRQALAELTGRQFDAKRNQINRLHAKSGFRCEELRTEHIPDCFRVLEEWLAWRRSRHDTDIAADGPATHEALKYLGRLPLKGEVIVVGNRVEAFSLNERLNRDTQVVQLEKATPRFGGIFAMIANQTAKRCADEIKWINRGQDLGIAGLRKAKRSFCPNHLIEKYRIRPARR
ncbi:MAG: DUF2156 domain-containing protein [Desulfobacteraceae bacterium]|nr:MAG: DUF2156 domain-containing protein [Desulfobacteraceae bacterium]